MNNETGFMISEPTYQAAKSVSAVIEAHFIHQLGAAQKADGQQLASAPPLPVIEAIIDVAFWASLRKEEGRPPKISIAYLQPAQADLPLMFQHRMRLTPETLTKLGPAVERSGIHLGVWCEDDELYIWGTTRSVPGFCFVLEVVEPGVLVIKHRRMDGFGKFVNVAVLQGDRIKIIDENSGNLPDCPALLTSLLGFSTPSSWHTMVNVHVQLAVSMRAHGLGGTLLVVPAEGNDWNESIIHPLSYPIVPVFCGLADLMKVDVNDDNLFEWQEEFSREIDNVAGLTAVDGATIINDRHELLAFGAKIGRASRSTRVQEMMVTEPLMNTGAIVVHPGSQGGTRHLSAAQFVYDQRDAFALVASQDGRFTIFSWSPCEGMVHAHRVDSLLL